MLLNLQEAQTLLGQTEIKPESAYDLGGGIVVVTDGRRGSKVYTSDKEIITQKAFKAKAREETGAGDAFGSAFVAGRIHGLSVKTALQLAALNAASVVRQIGPKEGLLFWPDAQRKLAKLQK